MAGKVDYSVTDSRGQGWYGGFNWIQLSSLETLEESLQAYAVLVGIKVPMGIHSIGPFDYKYRASRALVHINNYAQHLKSYKARGKTPLSFTDWFDHCIKKAKEKRAKK